MAGARRGRGMRRGASKAKAKAKRPAKLSKPMARAVKAIIHRQAERKYRSESYQRSMNAVTNSNINEMWPCVVQTTQAGAGTASSSQRVGQKVTVARCYTDFHFSFPPGITGSKDIVVKLWVLASKELKNYDDIANIGVVGNPRQLPINWLNDGNGGTQGALGFLYDLNLPVETEQWTSLKEYVFRLTKSSHAIENNNQGYGAPPAAYVAGGGTTMKRIRVYHKAPKNLLFDANLGSQYPTNFAPVWCASYAYVDGTNPVPANQELFVDVRNHLEFYDA